MIRAVYPGTFDPLTRGHEDIVRRAASLFDGLIIGVADSQAKRPFFTRSERVDMASEVLSDLKNVKVVGFSGLLINFIREHEARVIMRGLRAVADFEYEFPARRHESQPVSGRRDDFSHALGAAHVHFGYPGARDRHPGRRRLQVRAPACQGQAKRESEVSRGLSQR